MLQEPFPRVLRAAVARGVVIELVRDVRRPARYRAKAVAANIAGYSELLDYSVIAVNGHMNDI